MIRRSINPQFNQAIWDDIKFTTIRENPWPVGVPIMLYNWSGAAYRSKQIDVAVVMVEGEAEILITNVKGIVTFTPDNVDGIPLHVTEGFGSHRQLQDWFEKLVKPGQTVTKHMMRFRLLERRGA